MNQYENLDLDLNSEKVQKNNYPEFKLPEYNIETKLKNDIYNSFYKVTENIQKITMNNKEKSTNVIILAVSKKQTIDKIICAYAFGHRDFGENYVDELYEKSTNELILSYCPNIRWHFVGHLQSNKVNKLLNCKNLKMIQSIHNHAIALKINSRIQYLKDSSNNDCFEKKINVLIQVNTSHETFKSGCIESDVFDIIKYIQSDCGNLEFSGLMTIGIKKNSENNDFATLANLRKDIYHQMGDIGVLLSMGMSNDYENAIKHGSDIVRLGTILFGSRIYNKL
ncbi:Proline synthase co-transcribed bacterial protein [Intoshia linei]|uniref:Pyridoxal phosphate homeostasis protein n=1 Tax=Intoshia linei TaxID=1819745 RepID=A0A177BCV2_9BILA|nr:Proline synthase co-transcribed bacterial protein [Intoshia linei]